MRPRLRLFLVFLGALAGAMMPSPAAAQGDVIRGHVTSVDGTLLSGVRVTATSIPGNVTRTTRTDSRGAFRIAFPGGQGDYIMGFALIGFSTRQFEIKRTADQDVLVADTRLAPMQLDTVITTARQQQRIGRDDRATPNTGGTESNVSPGSLTPDQRGNLTALVGTMPGVSVLTGLNGRADGFSVLGMGADANSLTLNGLAFGSNGLPRDAAITASLTTSSFDPSRGGFSGANLNLTSGSGSNFTTRGINVVTSSPYLQWTDRAANALGTKYTNVSVGGLTSGPLQLNKAFYSLSYQLDHRTNTNPTLLNTTSLGLQTAGVAPDSVTHFLGILDAQHIPRVAANERRNQRSDYGSVFGTIDIQPPSSLNGVSYGITFSAGGGRRSPVGGAPTQLASASGDNTDWNGGLQLRTDRYIGLILSETSLGVNASGSNNNPYLQLPAGQVRVNSVLDDDARAVRELTFGGNQDLFDSWQSTSGFVQNTLSWFDDANKHRIKLTTDLQYAGLSANQARNLLGTFEYNSLDDFAAGRPASYTRQLTSLTRQTSQYTGALALGDSWRRTSDLQIQYGLRLETTRFANEPAYNADVTRLFDRRNDRLPAPVTISPRLGFSWTLGNSQEIAAFAGAFRPPRAVVRGGIGVFANRMAAEQIGNALDNTGLPSGIQQLVCSGGAAPRPDWSAYASDRGAIPLRCADGSGALFANAAPNVVLFANALSPQRSVRANLSWLGPIAGARLLLTTAGTVALNLNQQQVVDLNFRSAPQFALDAERGRPVFVAATSIDPLTGAIAAGDARTTALFNRVSEVRSDISSRTAQLSVALSPIQRMATRFTWSTAYTLTAVREQVPGFENTAGNPLDKTWSLGATGLHQVSYSLRYNLFDYVLVHWSGQFRSGRAFTPMVGSDMNGDGFANDRAFINNPATVSDTSLAQGLRALVAQLPGGVGACLVRQFGQVAERNTCRAPWSASAALNVSLDRTKFRLPPRASVNFSLSNPLAAADLLVNGSEHLKGWGQNPFPDQQLYYVKGFDRASKRFAYVVNERFGQTRPQFVTLRAPVTMSVSLRLDLGQTREHQRLTQELNYGRQSLGTPMSVAAARSFGSNGLPNPMLAIIQEQDSLRLTSAQADSLASMNRSYTFLSDSLWTPVAVYLSGLPPKFRRDDATDRYQRARRAQVDLLLRFAPLAWDILTPVQRRKLPAEITAAMDPRVLRFIRAGTGLYATGDGFGR